MGQVTAFGRAGIAGIVLSLSDRKSVAERSAIVFFAAGRLGTVSLKPGIGNVLLLFCVGRVGQVAVGVRARAAGTQPSSRGLEMLPEQKKTA